MVSVYLVIPTYNEYSNISILLEELFALSLGLSLVVVDDNSPDGTAAAVKRMQSRYQELYLIERPRKTGLGSAYRAGFEFALDKGGQIIGEMDADFSHQPSALPQLLGAIAAGADVIIGSRRVPGGRIIGWGWHRHLMSWAAVIAARLVLGLKTKDITSGFRLYTRAALAKITWQGVKSEGYAWQEETLYLCEQAGLKITEMPIVFIDRKQGQSKLKFKDIVEFFATILRLRFKK